MQRHKAVLVKLMKSWSNLELRGFQKRFQQKNVAAILSLEEAGHNKRDISEC